MYITIHISSLYSNIKMMYVYIYMIDQNNKLCHLLQLYHIGERVHDPFSYLLLIHLLSLYLCLSIVHLIQNSYDFKLVLSLSLSLKDFMGENCNTAFFCKYEKGNNFRAQGQNVAYRLKKNFKRIHPG